MTKRDRKGFGIEIPFPPELFTEKPTHGSFYDDDEKGERVPSSGAMRIPSAEKKKNKLNF